MGLIWFWSLLSLASILWYIVTVFIIGVKGFQDIKNMLSAVNSKNNDPNPKKKEVN